MSFTISQTLSKQTFYKELGAFIDDGSESVDVTYEYSGLTSYDGTTVSATYQVTIGGVVAAEPYRFNYAYSGNANPTSVAEDELESFLKTL